MATKKAKAKKRASSSRATASSDSPFGPGLLKFLRELQENNTKAWFEANKERYEQEVREPALAFIRAMAPHVRKVSSHLLAVDKKVGGSLMRVHRDVRFSADKRPYKTNLGIQFRHEDGKDVHAPGLYVHVDPQEVFVGAGMWHPESQALAAVRQSIDRDPKAWQRVRDNKKFREDWALEGDSLKTAPRGYAKDHPMLEDLRRKDHIAVVRLPKSTVTRGDLVPYLGSLLRNAKPYMAWQAQALDLPF